MKKPPSALLATWLLVGYVIALLSLFLLNAEGPHLLIVQILLGVPWLAAPAAFAASLVIFAPDDPLRSWGGLTLEAAVIGSMGWAMYYLSQHPDAQNGIGIALLPLVQFGGIGVGMFGLFLLRGMLERTRPETT